MNVGRFTYDLSTRIRSTWAKDAGRRTSGMSPHIYSPCAPDTGKQREVDLCRYLHIGIGPAIVHMSSAISIIGKFIRRTVKNLPTSLANII